MTKGIITARMTTLRAAARPGYEGSSFTNFQMVVLKTSMPARPPSASSISNACSEMTADMSVMTRMAGIMMGMTMRRSVPSTVYPAMRDCSSSDESMFLNAGASNTTLMAMLPVTRCTQTMPHHE